MTRRLVAIAVAIVAVAVVWSATESSLDVDRELPVGRVTKAYRDADRRSWVSPAARPMETLVWYPAVADTSQAEWYSGIRPFKIFRFGVSAAGAPRRPGRYPLIVLSHGTGGSPRQLAWLAEALASRGFLVAAVSHHGNTSDEAESIPHGFYLWWERPMDLSRVLDRLLADPQLAGAIDPQRIGAAGFSLGGYTVLALAGARLDMHRYRQWCARTDCKGPPEAPMPPAEFFARHSADAGVADSLSRAEHSYRDERVRAAFAIAPALGPALDAQSLRNVAIPVSIVVGERDVLFGDAQEIATAIPQAGLVVLPAVGHYTFLAPCAWLGRLAVPALCRDADDVSRSDVHRRVAEDAFTFFTRSLE